MMLNRFLAIVIAVTFVASVATAEMSLGRKRSTVERMQLERLKATHEDVMRIKETRIDPDTLPHKPKLTDFRGMFHVHAEDSSHTAGTLPELHEAALQEGVDVIWLSDHFRPPRDYMDKWRELKDGVLFIPGCEGEEMLIYPEESIFDMMKYQVDPERKPDFIKAVTEGTGMIFLCHGEERLDHPMEGLTGMEFYNLHTDFKGDTMALFALVPRMTSLKGSKELLYILETYPDEFFGAQCDYLHVLIDKFDAETQHQRVVAVAANDCHHNNVYQITKVDDETALIGTNVDKEEDLRKITTKNAPGLAEILKGAAPGEIAVEYDIDPYPVSMRNVTTHIFAEELAEPAMRAAVAAGHCYIAHEWMSKSDGFYFHLMRDGGSVALMGDQRWLEDGDVLAGQFPVPCIIRLLKDGEEIDRAKGAEYTYEVSEPGVYRIEGWFEIDGEERPWIYSNPIYLR